MYIFVDSESGRAPVIGNEIWSSGNIANDPNRNWRSMTADAKGKIITGGDYFFKIGFWATTGASQSGPITIDLDNAKLAWNYAGTSYPATAQIVRPANAFTAPDMTNWRGFTEIADKTDGEIYYQLSANGGSSWKYWNGSSWADTTSTNSSWNTATEINNYINTFPADTKSLLFRAFLFSNGTANIHLDDITISYDAEAEKLASNNLIISGTRFTGLFFWSKPICNTL
jgi:hypothetical protein